MARAIDADAVISYASNKKMTEIFPNFTELSSETRNALGMFGQYWKALLEDAPTINTVKHGKWEWEGFMVCKCSECKETFYELGGTNYCPNCGARMDGE